jgi:hypothetical protein
MTQPVRDQSKASEFFASAMLKKMKLLATGKIKLLPRRNPYLVGHM